MARPVALVTGASSGIGEAFARGLAARAHDLVVVARDVARLEALAEQLGADHGATIDVLGADLTTVDGLGAVSARLGDEMRPVDLLVNNAGVGTEGRFWELPMAGEDAELRLNVLALMHLTHAALGPMVARGSGGVINVSSIAAYQPVPMSATYGATKAFVSSFTNAVREELRGTGVKAMVVAPGFTRTGFQATSIAAAGVPGFAWQSSEAVAETALRAYERGRAVCITGAVNVATVAASSVLPTGITRRVSGLVTRWIY
jgi:short-subunit dehydrogenase